MFVGNTHTTAKHSTKMVAEGESLSVGVKQKVCSTPIGAFLKEARHTHTHTHTHTRTHTHTHTHSCQQTDEHNAKSGCRFLVSWSSSKTKHVQRKQAHSGSSELTQSCTETAALHCHAGSPGFHVSIQLWSCMHHAKNKCDHVSSHCLVCSGLPLCNTHTHTHTHTYRHTGTRCKHTRARTRDTQQTGNSEDAGSNQGGRLALNLVRQSQSKSSGIV